MKERINKWSQRAKKGIKGLRDRRRKIHWKKEEIKTEGNEGRKKQNERLRYELKEETIGNGKRKRRKYK
jgi:hypothetical protein